jgi:hypothetical protein
MRPQAWALGLRPTREGRPPCRPTNHFRPHNKETVSLYLLEHQFPPVAQRVLAPGAHGLGPAGKAGLPLRRLPAVAILRGRPCTEGHSATGAHQPERLSFF